jgi:hypothetical protein
VNYFGHAAIASWAARDGAADLELGGLALGAMLPDFASMCGARLAREDADDALVAAAPLERGIALHHRTDSVFHQLPPVTALMRELDDRLAHGGCARGPRRAVAHIGVELLLDGVLVDDSAYRAAYLAGIGHDGSAIRWREPTDPARFAALHTRLRSYGAPDDLRAPASIVQRLSRVLANRPLLAPSAADLHAIRDALIGQQPRIVIAADTVMRAMRAGLALTPS